MPSLLFPVDFAMTLLLGGYEQRGLSPGELGGGDCGGEGGAAGAAGVGRCKLTLA